MLGVGDLVMVDFSVQRTNMVESQVRPSDITDRRIIRAMLEVPRERFCPPSSSATAYMDLDVKLSDAKPGTPARYLTATRVLAKLIQGLELNATDHVLHVGAATGYASLILARLAPDVTALEPDAGHGTALAANIAADGLPSKSVTVVSGPLAAGHAAGAPYDAILVDGAIDDTPQHLLEQLRDGGRMVAIIGTGRVGRITRWQRRGTLIDTRVLGDAGAPKLPGFDRAAAFVF
jgi:protein-L-isoaspartate(D-aspartate) O-methyltransferase